jgi:ParB family chromosome partitioning protein
MAKRKRLTPPTMLPDAPGISPVSANRPPIAQVAAEAASHAALEEVSAELHSARSEGRMVQALPLDAIKVDHLVRDRIALDATEMEALRSSLLARGQQASIEVVDLGQGAYGLISGFRRLTALQGLLADTGEDRFGHIQALVKPIGSAADSYLAMVEENEIRADLSFYERARLAAEAAELGIYPNAKKAVHALFAAAPAPKRSKIVAFLPIHKALGDVLRFPAAIPEKVGLKLSAMLGADAGFATALRKQLLVTAPDSAERERKLLDSALRGAGQGKAAKPQTVEVATGIWLEAGKGRIILSGKGVTADLHDALRAWLTERGRSAKKK